MRFDCTCFRYDLDVGIESSFGGVGVGTEVENHDVGCGHKCLVQTFSTVPENNKVETQP